MSSHVMLTHRTCYRYDRPVNMGPQTIRLRPTVYSRTPVLSYHLHVQPADCLVRWTQDMLGNQTACVECADQVTHFDIEVALLVDLSPYDPLSGSVTGQELFDGAEYTAPQIMSESMRALLGAQQIAEAQGALNKIKALNRVIAQRIHYQRRMEPGVWSAEETLHRASGSCRDSAWLLVTAARHLGFSARFVSGYLIQDECKESKLRTLNGDLHAWAQVFIPQKGWIGFDTTSGFLAGAGHIPLAVANTPQDAAPVSGVLDCCEAVFDVFMQVQHLPPQ
ncbi:transglutaminase [Acetobacter aceti 1023]|nr:transglutaminase [Acetobacter aceti 1023]